MNCKTCKNSCDCKEREVFEKLDKLGGGLGKCSGYEPKTMPDDKLTDVTDNNVGKISDSEIIKALECCSEANNCGQCEYEPTEYQIGTVGCCNELMKDALNLINRLQADKQSLKYDYDNLQRQFDEIYQQFHYLSNVEIPYLYSFTEDKDKKLETIANILLRTKAEAYKECIEKVKEKSKKSEIVCSGALVTTSYLISAKNLNNLLKELVGE